MDINKMFGKNNFKSFKPLVIAFGVILFLVCFRYFGYKIEISRLTSSIKDLGVFSWAFAGIVGIFVWLLQTSNTNYLTAQKESYKDRFEDLKSYNKDTIQREVRMILSEELKNDLSKIVTDALKPVNTRLDGIDRRLDNLEQGQLILTQNMSEVQQRLDSMDGRLDSMEGRLDSIENHLTQDKPMK